MLAGRAGHGAEISTRMGNAVLATGTESGRGQRGCGIGASHRIADARVTIGCSRKERRDGCAVLWDRAVRRGLWPLG